MALCTLKIFRHYDSKLLEAEVNTYLETLDATDSIEVVYYPVLNSSNVLESTCYVVNTKKPECLSN